MIPLGATDPTAIASYRLVDVLAVDLGSPA